MECIPFYHDDLDGFELHTPSKDELHAADKWILSKVNTLAKDATEIWINLNSELLYRKYTISSGMSSVTGTLRSQKSVPIKRISFERSVDAGLQTVLG